VYDLFFCQLLYLSRTAPHTITTSPLELKRTFYHEPRIYYSRWTAGPEIFGLAGYARCVYIDGDILAATPMPPPETVNVSDTSRGTTGDHNSIIPGVSSGTSSSSKGTRPEIGWDDGIQGGFSCGLLRTELSALLDGNPRAGPRSKAPVLPQPRLVAGALESSLGVMLAALGASDHDYALHDSTFGVRLCVLSFQLSSELSLGSLLILDISN